MYYTQKAFFYEALFIDTLANKNPAIVVQDRHAVITLIIWPQTREFTVITK